ncbi:MAG TPA: alkaline phosphatase family protein [Thermoanaerobaculia bacterium]
MLRTSRPAGWRLFVRLCLTLLTALACTRTPPRRVIFVGLDGADWRLLDPFMADGTMPELANIVAHGERRVLLTQHPPLSPLVWTTMMTGVSPLEHRILDFTRYDPRTRAQEPITSDERAVPAIWNMAVESGKKVGVFGMWATYPPEPGVVLTDRDLPRDYAAATELVSQRALGWIGTNQVDLAIVYIQGTDEIGHLTSGNREKARGYFHRVDEILGEFRALAERQHAQLVIASDHGFDWGGRHEESSTATATAAKWHRNEGIWIRWPAARATSATSMRVDQVCGALQDLVGLRKDRRYTKPRITQHASGENAEQLAKLKALGYIGSTAPAPRNAASTRTPQSYNNEGLILREAGRIEEAERAFDSALRLDATYASARQNLDDLLSKRGLARLQARDCRGAVADLRRIAADSAPRWTAIAAAEGCLGHEDAAREAFERAVRLDPDVARAIH